MMRSMLLAFLFCSFSWASAPGLRVTNATDWKFAPLEKDSQMSQLLGGAVGVLTYGQSQADGPEVTVALLQFELPKNEILGEDLASWHRFVFAGPQPNKINIVKEMTYRFKGKWRYYIEFETDTATKLNTALLVTVGEGSVRAFSYVNHRAAFRDKIQIARKLFRRVEVTSGI